MAGIGRGKLIKTRDDCVTQLFYVIVTPHQLLAIKARKWSISGFQPKIAGLIQLFAAILWLRRSGFCLWKFYELLRERMGLAWLIAWQHLVSFFCGIIRQKESKIKITHFTKTPLKLLADNRSLFVKAVNCDMCCNMPALSCNFTSDSSYTSIQFAKR